MIQMNEVTSFRVMLTFQAQMARQPPRQIRYVPVPGEWEREAHPNWPDSVFKMPEVVPDGYIYYFTKGEYVGSGSTALVERLPFGGIAKSPLANPYDPREEQQNRENMDREYHIYCLIGPSPFVPKVLDWDGESKTLVLEDHVNGDLLTYGKTEHAGQPEIRRKWALQAAQALATLHAVGVVHQDVTPRNFLVTEELELRICDFAGSSYPGHTVFTGAPGPRYQSKVWGRGYRPTQQDDIFSLGSVLYFIMTGEEPYSTLEDEEVEELFRKANFPATDELIYGSIIRGCWRGTFPSVENVVAALAEGLQERQ